MKQDLLEYKYGIKEVRTDGTSGIVFARFLFSDDRNKALKAIRENESEDAAEFTKLIPVRFRRAGESR